MTWGVRRPLLTKTAINMKASRAIAVGLLGLAATVGFICGKIYPEYGLLAAWFGWIVGVVSVGIIVSTT